VSTVHVEQPHSLSVDEVKVKLEAFAADIAKYGMKLVWAGSRADLKGTGASGSVVVEATKVIVEVKLGMIAKAAGVKADRLEGSIKKRLASALGAET